MSKSTMSVHFAMLLEADPIEAEKTGRVIQYRLRAAAVRHRVALAARHVAAK